MSHTHNHPEPTPRPQDHGASTGTSDEGWLNVTDLVIEGREPPEGRLQLTSCWRSGDLFIKPVRGRYRGLPLHEIASRSAEIRPLLDAMGLVVDPDPALSPAEHLEYLENVLEFEMTCPCGCATHPGSPPDLQ